MAFLFSPTPRARAGPASKLPRRAAALARRGAWILPSAPAIFRARTPRRLSVQSPELSPSSAYVSSKILACRQRDRPALIADGAIKVVHDAIMLDQPRLVREGRVPRLA